MKKIFILTAAALTVFAACSKEKDIVSEEKLPAGMVKASFYADIDQTKSTESGAVFSWTENEEVAVVAADDATKQTFTCDNVSEGHFTGTIGEGKSFGFAISPYNAAGDMIEDSGDVLYEIIFATDYNDYVPGTTNAIMVGTPGASGKFMFRHAAAAFKFTVENVPVGTAVVSVATNANITGTVSKNVLSGSGLEISNSDSGLNGKEVDLYLKDAVTAPNQTLTFYVPVPTGNYTSLTVTFFDGSLNELVSKEKTGLNINLSRGDVYYTPKMTLDESDLSGDYMILSVGSGYWQVMSTTFNTKYWEKTASSVASDAVIDWTSSAVNFAALSNADHKWTLEKVSGQTGKYYLKHGDAYAHAGSSGNGSEDTVGEAFSVSYDPSTGAAHIAAESVELRYNTSAPRFTFYTTGGQAQVYLIPFVAAATPCEITSISCASNTVTITATPANAEIHYTIDGTDPDANSTLYTEPFAISQTVTVKAIAIAPSAEYADSQIASQECSYVAPGTATYYEKVTSALSDWSGEYLLVCESENKALSEISTTSTKYGIGADVTISSDKIESTATVDAYKVTIAPATEGSAYTLALSGNYLYWGSGNSLNVNSSESDNARWTISAGATSGNWIIANVGDSAREIWYNTGSPRFACYTGKGESSAGYAPVQLYKLQSAPDNRQEAGMTWSTASASASIEDGDVINFTAPTLSNPNSVSPLAYVSTNTDVAEINVSGKITIKAEGTTTIQAVFTGDTNYKPQTVEYTLAVTDNRTPVVNYAFQTVAELNALASNTEVEKFGKLTDAVVSFVPNTKNAVIKDATGSVLFYKDGHGLLQGQTFSGDVTVKVKLYNDCSEITACDANFTGSGAVVTPATPTLSQLVGHLSDWQNAYVQVSGLEVTAVDGKNVTVTDNANSYVVYSSAANASCVVGDVITVTGTVSHHSDKDQITAWSTDAIVVTYHPVASHTITISQPEGAAATAGCSIAASANGSSVASGASLQEGTVVTITATEGTDYSFVSWTVTGATVSDASANPATFTVGTDDVTVSATFADDNAGTPGSETFDLTKKTYTTGSDYVTWSGSSVSITNSSASGGTVATNYLGGDSNNRTSSRFYSSNTLTIAPKSGYTITSVVFSATSANYATAFSGSNWTNATSSVSGSTVTVIPTNGANNITAVIGGTCGFTGITVYYLYSGSGSQTPVTYAVTWSNPTGGTIAATVGGNAISSGDKFEEGTLVSITASPSSGYTFSSWSLTGATATNASSASTTFTVGTSDVTVSASFTQSQPGNNPVTVVFVAGTDTSTSTTLSKDGVTLTTTSGTFSRTDNYRIYANNSLTVTAPSGKVITSIAFTISQNTFTTTNGTYDSATQTWSGSSNSVTLSASGGQVRATRIEVTYN